jgi:hypothetical protein
MQLLQRLGLDGGSSGTPSPQKDCIILAACEANETLPQSAEFPADVFTACLTTPIKMALHWYSCFLILIKVMTIMYASILYQLVLHVCQYIASC